MRNHIKNGLSLVLAHFIGFWWRFETHMSPGSHANNTTGNDVDTHLMLVKTSPLSHGEHSSLKALSSMYNSFHACVIHLNPKFQTGHVVFNYRRALALSQGMSSDDR